METIFKTALSVLGFLFTGLIILGLLVSIPVFYLYRAELLRKLKEKIAWGDYTRIVIVIIASAFIYLAAINIAAIKLGLASDSFWIIKDYLSSLFFILATIEIIIKKGKLWGEFKTKLKVYPFSVLFFSVWYILGGITIGYFLFE